MGILVKSQGGIVCFLPFKRAVLLNIVVYVVAEIFRSNILPAPSTGQHLPISLGATVDWVHLTPDPQGSYFGSQQDANSLLPFVCFYLELSKVSEQRQQ